MVGCLDSGQVAEAVVHQHPLTFLMVKGVGCSSGGCQAGLPVFFLSLIPSPFLSIFMDPSGCGQQGWSLRGAFKTSASSAYLEVWRL